MTFERFKDSLKGKNRNELFNIRMELTREIMKHNLKRKNPTREGNNQLIHDNKKKIAIINSITEQMIRQDLFYWKKEDNQDGGRQ